MDTDSAMALQLDALERLERTELELRIACLRVETLVPGAPLRLGVEATDRYRRALVDRDDAQAAWDAAQDIECPDGIELVNERDIIWCERCGAATDRGACGCMRSVKRVG
jgi:hypothetical protein